MKHIFIVNSISGKGKGLKVANLIEEVCKEMGLDFEIKYTKYSGHAKEIAKSYKASDNVILYAVGGDGTILEVVNAMDKDIVLGVIPGGSGEDFLRYFKLDTKDLKQYIINTISANPINIDIGQTDRMKYLNTTSFGIDATINEEASQMIRKTILTKGLAYIMSIIKNAIIIKPTHAKINVDGVTYDEDFLIVSCMNGRYYGNGVCAAPNSDIQDGCFDLVLLRNIKGLKKYKILINYLSGKSNKIKEIEIIHAKHVIVDTDYGINIQSDGENYKSNHLEIDMLESYLKLKIPARN